LITLGDRPFDLALCGHTHGGQIALGAMIPYLPHGKLSREYPGGLYRLGDHGERALVVSEGLLVYLSVAEVGALASALHAAPAFQWWLTDLASPRLLKWMHKRWSKHVGQGNAPFRVAPAEGSSFFLRYGCSVCTVLGLSNSLVQEATRRSRRNDVIDHAEPSLWCVSVHILAERYLKKYRQCIDRRQQMTYVATILIS
jgi:hypothetical protein